MNDEHPARRIQRLRSALEEGTPIPPDLRQWVRDGLRTYARGAPSLDVAFGLQVRRGEAWRHPARQIARARLERLMLDAAEGLEGGDSARATQIAYALDHFAADGFDDLPDTTARALSELVAEFGTVEIPTTRTPILQILRGETRAQRDGLV